MYANAGRLPLRVCGPSLLPPFRALPCPVADLDAQKRVDLAFQDKEKWTEMSIMSTAGMGKFSTDRTYVLMLSLPSLPSLYTLCARVYVPFFSIRQYAEEIWGLKPARRPHPTECEGDLGRVRSFPNFDPNFTQVCACVFACVRVKRKCLFLLQADAASGGGVRSSKRM